MDEEKDINHENYSSLFSILKMFFFAVLRPFFLVYFTPIHYILRNKIFYCNNDRSPLNICKYSHFQQFDIA